MCSLLPSRVQTNFVYLEGLELADYLDRSQDATDVLVGSYCYWDIVVCDIMTGDWPTTISSKFTAKLQTNGQRKTRIRNSQVCEIIISFLYSKEPYFHKRNWLPLDSFPEQCNTNNLVKKIYFKFNAIQIQLFKLLSFTWKIYLVGRKMIFEQLDRLLDSVLNWRASGKQIDRPTPLPFRISWVFEPHPLRISNFLCGGMDIFWNHTTNTVVAWSITMYH